jgi:MFS family permease
VGGPAKSGGAGKAIVVAWLITSLFYFHQYMMRSAPAVMMPELAGAYGLSAVGLASLVGSFYYGYAPFSLVAGVALDQLGARRAIPLGAALVAVGAGLFASGDPTLGGIGRFLQGAGGAFALIGAAYIATNYFSAARVATLIGATQMFGMAGGSAGQFVVGPVIAAGLAWNQFWLVMAAVGAGITVLLVAFIPSGRAKAAANESDDNSGWAMAALSALGGVLRNPQSILCGVIAGLMFTPTTIFDMVWGVRYLQEAHDIPYEMAVMRSASVPFGWIIGCPLLGALSDRLGRRKPVIVAGGLVLLASLALMLYGPHDLLPPFGLGLVAGVGSGAAMLPYTIIKEANRPEYSGTATGVVNFLNFAITAVLGPILGGLLAAASGGGERELPHYQAAFSPLLWGVAAAVLLTLLLKETGVAARVAQFPRAQPTRP